MYLLEHDEECLQHGVGKPWAGADEVDDPFEVVDQDDGQGGLVAVQEDLGDVRRLRRLQQNKHHKHTKQISALHIPVSTQTSNGTK